MNNMKTMLLLAVLAVPVIGYAQTDSGKICRLETKCHKGDIVAVRGVEQLEQICDFTKDIVTISSGNYVHVACVARGGLRTYRFDLDHPGAKKRKQ